MSASWSLLEEFHFRKFAKKKSGAGKLCVVVDSLCFRVRCRDSAGPVTLPEEEDEDEPFAEDDAVVSGWGTTTAGGFISSVLRQVEVPVLSDDGKKCQE